LKWVAPSWIDTAEYCEYQLYLEQVVGIKAEDKDTAQGRRKHRERSEEFNEGARKVDISPRELVPLAKRKNKAFELCEVGMRSLNYKIFGRVDRLRVSPDWVKALDFKSGKAVYGSEKLQVRCYSLLAREYLETDIPTYSIILDRDNKELIWKERFTEEARNQVLGRVKSIREILNGKREPRKAENPNKCHSCRYREVCSKRLERTFQEEEIRK